MSITHSLGQFEQLTMAAILALEENAYGVTIHAKVEELSQSKKVSLGAVYATLDRLEDKKLIVSWLSNPTKARGGRSRRHYRLEKSGIKALRESVDTARRVSDAIATKLGTFAMEAEPALTGPPPLLERTILFLIPAGSRESVGGDLCELYRSPWQYGWQAARALPFVVASQARRNANFPLLALQGLILLGCFGGLFALGASGQGWNYAVLATLASLFFLFVLGAYQKQERPSCRRAIMETILLTGMVSLFFPQLLLGLTSARAATVFVWPGFALLGCVMAMIPVLCCLRAGLILEADRRVAPLEETLAVQDVPQDYRRFQQQTAWRNQVESAALIVGAVVCALLGNKFAITDAQGSLVVAGGYACAALYLLAGGSAPAMPQTADFLSLRALYQYELARRHQLRRFLSWLWCAPLFLVLYTSLILHGTASGQPSEVTLGILAALLLGFFIDALNREGRTDPGKNHPSGPAGNSRLIEDGITDRVRATSRTTNIGLPAPLSCYTR